MNNLIARAAELICAAQHAVALTGAGISVPSGIPDFRSPGSGLWEKYDPIEVASLDAFRRRPEAFFNWIRPLAAQMLSAQPNPAHYALANLETCGRLKAVITQNVDGLHQRAGSRNVLEVHGHLREAVCIRCYQVLPSEQFVGEFLVDGLVPHCPHCNGVLKPNVILFGEQLPVRVMLQAQQEISKCDLVLVAGSSLEVIPIADLPLWARRRGARVIIVNLQPTYMDGDVDIVLNAELAETLPQIASACQEMMKNHE